MKPRVWLEMKIADGVVTAVSLSLVGYVFVENFAYRY